ncbi:hypothetical protein [Neorhodopirellula pilleata]|uniref:Uncharacterized protein n=1 Tax=Neorhodopirellula pilleata TaxID=2714738 RepID=A0A5C6ACW8_9BACT|nr:hypothetical protein [Neorhodopirellula pilleata]TWT97280.1 hypothetical protein Pla100_24300 [Neorhodopirellula pilleata]
MTQKRKIWIGVATVSVLLLYFFGLLWPLVRFILSGAAIVGLGTSAFLAFRYFKASQSASSDPSVERPQSRQALSAGFATVMIFLLLSCVPSDQPVERDTPPTRSLAETSVEPTHSKPTISEIDPEPAKPTPQLPKVIAKAKVKSNPPTESQAKVRPTPEKYTPKPATRTPQVQTKPKISADEADMAAAKLMGALIGAAAEQQRRQQEQDRNDPRLKYAGEGGNVCIQCDGAKVYCFVDANGVLQVQTCPRCRGTGNAF